MTNLYKWAQQHIILNSQGVESVTINNICFNPMVIDKQEILVLEIRFQLSPNTAEQLWAISNIKFIAEILNKVFNDQTA
jgi:hypothetical protein